MLLLATFFGLCGFFCGYLTKEAVYVIRAKRGKKKSKEKPYTISTGKKE